MSDVYLAAAGGPDTDPGALAFAPLRDGNAYHFDLAQPLHPLTLAASVGPLLAVSDHRSNIRTGIMLSWN